MLVAGLNHFIHPQFYIPLIPDYLPFPEALNIMSGILEVLFALLLLLKASRKLGAHGILLLLILFIPSHVYFIEIGACVPDGLCTPHWVAWVRLLIVHPLLILWAWIAGKS